MGFNRQAWTPEEDATLMERLANNEAQIDIARSFPGRSEKSVLTRVGRIRGMDNQNLDRRKARNSSQKLLDATMRLMVKMDESVLRDVLFPIIYDRTPGTERVMKTCQVERLAA